MSAPIIPNPVEIAAERAYCAFLESAKDFLPPYVQEWSHLHPRIRIAWIEAISAVYDRDDEQTDA